MKYNKFKSDTQVYSSQGTEVLRQVEEIVKQRLSCHVAEVLKAIQDNHHCAFAVEALLHFNRRFVKLA